MTSIAVKLSNNEIIKMKLRVRGSETIIFIDDTEYKASNFFQSLLLVRKDFEKKGLSLLCIGSRYDVYPSRMTIQMSNGKKAYQLRLGKQTKNDDIVNIFDSAPLEKIGTIEQQRNFYQQWTASLRNS